MTSRRHVLFPCEGSWLAGTIDEPAAGSKAGTGLLIVTGGNELRSGAWGGQAQFAAAVAAAGYPVFRFDRRGVGDSEGGNGGFTTSAPDIAAALAAFRDEWPALDRVVAWGNCDGASALMLAGGAGCNALVLSNPWTIEDEAAPPPAEMVRDHYRRRLADPAAIRRLLTGQVSPLKLLRSLASALRPKAATPENALVAAMRAGLEGFSGPVTFPIAQRDRTGQAFVAAWPRGDGRIAVCPDSTHSFVETEARAWIAAQLVAALRG